MLAFAEATSDASNDDTLSTKSKVIKQDSQGRFSVFFFSRTRACLTITFSAKSSEKPSNATRLPAGKSKRSFEETVQTSPGVLARRDNVANELFPADENEDNGQLEPKKFRQVHLSPPKSRPALPQSESSPPQAYSNSSAQQPPHQAYGHYAAPLNHPHGISGVPPGFYPGYGHHYPPSLHQYQYPDSRHVDPPNQYPYPERHAGPVLYNHAGENSYERGPYHEFNTYNHPYGYSSGTHQGQPPPIVHPFHGNHPPNVGSGSNVPAGRLGRHPSTTGGASGSSGKETEDGPIRDARV